MSFGSGDFPELDPNVSGAYLKRLGFDSLPVANAETLGCLHRAHLCTVPFENLDVHLNIPIRLDTNVFVQKIVERQRGGFCYELNGAFAALLSTIGFNVQLCEARVHTPKGLAGPFGHLCLTVHLDEGDYLVDVGFGRGCFDEPLQLGRQDVQVDTAGSFELKEIGDDEVDLFRDGVAQYRIASRNRKLVDFSEGCEFAQTSPESAHTLGTVCTLRTDDGRVTLAGRRLIETRDGQRSESELDRDAFGDCLAGRFSIRLGSEAVDRLFDIDPIPRAETIR